jgi:hypothetical protein
MITWYIFSSFGMLFEEKSGNPGHKPFFLVAGKLYGVVQQRIIQLISCLCYSPLSVLFG